jgi:hypothetical protein
MKPWRQGATFSEIIWQVGVAVLLVLIVIILWIDPRELWGEQIQPPPDIYRDASH